MAPSILERMYRRSPNAPPSRRVHGGYNLVYMSLRHVVFELVPESADFVSDVLYDSYVEPELIKFMEKYRAGDIEELLSAMLKARRTWAMVLRDNAMVDVRMIILPAKQIDVFRDEEKYPFGTQEGRFTELKERLVREAAGMPYHNSGGRDTVTGVMSFDIIMLKSALHEILTEKFRTAKGVNVQILTNAAPDPNTDLREDPECLFRYSKHDNDGAVTYDKVVTPSQGARNRGSTITRLRNGSSPKPWNYPYHSRDNVNWRPWDKADAPFSKDVFDPDSIDNWWQEDHKVRAAQVAEWKQEREERMQTGEEPDPDVFEFLEGLCNVYTSDRNYAWQKEIAKDEIIEFRRAEMVYLGVQQAHDRARDKLDHVRMHFPRNLFMNYHAKEELKTMKRVLNREETYFKALLASKYAQQSRPRAKESSTPVEKPTPSSMRMAETRARHFHYKYATKSKQGPPMQPPRKASATVAGPDEIPTKMASVRERNNSQWSAKAKAARRDSGVKIVLRDDTPAGLGQPTIAKDSTVTGVSALADSGSNAGPGEVVGISARARSKIGGVPMARLPANRNRSIRPVPFFERHNAPQVVSTSRDSVVLPKTQEKLTGVNSALKQGRLPTASIALKHCHQATSVTAVTSNYRVPYVNSESDEYSYGKELMEVPPSANSCPYRPILVQSPGGPSGVKNNKRVSFRMDSRLSKKTRLELAAMMHANDESGAAFTHPAQSGLASTESSPPDSLMWTPEDTPTEIGSPYDSPVGSTVSTPGTTPNASRRDSVDDPSEHCVSSPIDIRAPQTGKRIGQFRVDAATSLKAVMYLDGVKTVCKPPSRMQRLLARISSSAPLKRTGM